MGVFLIQYKRRNDMSIYEARLRHAQNLVKDKMVGLNNRLNVLNNDLICRVGLQDDEDDALMGCSIKIADATRAINRAIEELEG